jgi:UPF0176 protein
MESTAGPSRSSVKFAVFAVVGLFCLNQTMWEVSTFYRFVELSGLERLRDELAYAGEQLDLCGTIILANEGINSTIAGRPQNLREFMALLCRMAPFAAMEEKISSADKEPFYRFKVRIKKEIVTLGVQGINAAKEAGTYVSAVDWNRLIQDEDVVVIDTRNRYETRIGRFAGSVDPGTESFRQFPQWVDQNLDPQKTRKVAMYCTGGIRCEKATALLKARGFAEVYHLRGGILKYLEEVKPEASLWEGECFVFDGRVGIGHGLEQGGHVLCAGCRRPLSPEDLADPQYEAGVVCGYCNEGASDAVKSARRERHKQIRLAAERGLSHLGPKSMKAERQVDGGSGP